MTHAADPLGERLLELRRSFDRSFAERPLPRELRGDVLLAVRVAGEPYALRLSHLAALETRRSITPLPSDAPELLGLARVQAKIVAVYDLGALFGHALSRAPRWLALARGAPLAFAFDDLEERVREAGAGPGAGATDPRATIEGVVHIAGRPRSLIRLPALVSALDANTRPGVDEE